MKFLTDGKWFPFVSLAHAADTVDLDLCHVYKQNGSTVLVTSKGEYSHRQISTFGFLEECNDPICTPYSRTKGRLGGQNSASNNRGIV